MQSNPDISEPSSVEEFCEAYGLHEVPSHDGKAWTGLIKDSVVLSFGRWSRTIIKGDVEEEIWLEPYLLVAMHFKSSVATIRKFSSREEFGRLLEMVANAARSADSH